MKKTLKSGLVLMLSVLMVISCVSTISAATNTAVFLSSEGLGLSSQASNSSVYTEGAYGVTGTSWGAMNATTGGVSKGIYKDKAENAAYLGFATSTPLYVATTAENGAETLTAAGVSPLSAERYFIVPLVKTNNTTINNAQSVKFSDKIDDFENATVKIDLAKGSGYGNYDQSKIVGYKFGLAFVDYAKGSLSYKTGSTTRYVYRADFAWLDIAADSKNEINSLPTYSSSQTFDDSKYTVSVSVNDILTNGTHKKINSASVDVTAENANAVVIGVILNDGTYACGGSILFFNNLNVVTEDDTDPNAPVFSGNRQKADFTLWSRTGVATSTSYDADTYADRGVCAYNTWNALSSVTGSSSANIFTQHDIFATMSLARSVIANGTNFGANVTQADADRYRLYPLVNPGSSAPNQKAFKDYYDDISNFENGYLKVDMLKGGNFPAISAGDEYQYKAFRIGLAYVDYNTTDTYTSGSTRTVYAADISWLDITEQIEALNDFPEDHSIVDWNDVKTEISVSIDDIITNGTHKYINGATAATHTLTAQNANAVVFGIELENDVYPQSGNILYFDNLRISTEVPATSVSFDEESNLDDGVILNIQNGESSDITPLVFVAYYLGGSLVNVHVDTSFTAEAGYIGAKTAKYPIDNVNISSDRVVVTALDGSTFKPLCPSFDY